MNYNLNDLSAAKPKQSTLAGLKSLIQLIAHEKRNLSIAFGAILLNAILNLLGPFLIGYTIDHYIQNKQYDGLWLFSGILLVMYSIALFTSYFQTKLMGGVGQRMLFTLRNAVFNKLQELPLAFFNTNKAGDLISRVNNDTEKINNFFSQSLMQFIGSIVTMMGAGIFLLVLHPALGVAALLPAVFIAVFTQLVSPWVKRKNAANLQSVGAMSGEIQESLGNFKVIIAFNRRDYFRKRFQMANDNNYNTAIGAGLANNIFLPVFTMLSGAAQLIVLLFGIYLIMDGQFTIGLLVSYLAYATHFYNPLRQMAALWTNFQVAMAGWDRIAVILSLENNLPVMSKEPVASNAGSNGAVAGSNGMPISAQATPIIQFDKVCFSYDPHKEILHHVSLEMERGQTYAFVGPTGGGKTTTASLIARLYDPTSGTVYLDGKDLRTYSAQARTKKIGVILQEPFLFSGTVRENILYGNEQYAHAGKAELLEILANANLDELIGVFEKGLDTEVSGLGDSLSLGQKQLIAFMRAVLLQPEVLILDEATANIDTVTEQLLDTILKKLPASTTRIIIAHRLNTIENADIIYFVNSGEVTKAGSFDDALNMLLTDARVS